MLIICSECGKEYSDQAKSCPHCGAITSQNRYISSNMSGNNNRNINYSNQNNNIGVKLILAFFIIAGLLFFWFKIGVFDIIGGGEPSPDGTYKTVSVGGLFKDIESNALVAEDKYKGQYVSITGVIGKIDSSYVVIYESDITAGLNRVFCRIKSDEQKNIIKTLKEFDVVTVKGKITDIGEIKGCYLNITEISKNY